MSTEILIDPITRLEGHGRIHIFLDDAGAVDRALLQIPELRGFEKFVEGRRAEDMPQITSRICGVCPTAHHMAATKALDDLYQVDPPPAAKKIRELVYSTFMVEDHALHFFFLGGPDFVVGPAAPKADRNILGVIEKVGLDIGKEVIGVRKQLRDLIGQIAGKAIHPVFGLPGGVSRTLTRGVQAELKAAAAHAVQFGTFTLGVFRDVVLANPEYVELVTSEAYTHRTYYMGLVDAANKVTFYDGTLRVVGPGRPGVPGIPARGLPRACRRARRTLDLHEVLLPEGRRLEGLRRRARERRLRRGAAGTAKRQRRNGDAACPGGL